jgi:hypothetical protein
MLYVLRKRGNECTGVERYVKNLVLTEDPQFFPINRCIVLDGVDKPFKEIEAY